LFPDEKEIKTYRVRAICTECYTGEMIPTGGYILTNYPPRYPHICKKCGYRENLDREYPYIQYKED
jgi:hypothetical protein